MVIDIGGGTTDIAVISLGGIVRSKNIKIAGDKLNNDIISYIRNEFKILIGEKTAEEIKIAVGAVMPKEALETPIRGRDLITGLPREVIITDSDIREAIGPSIDILVEATQRSPRDDPAGNPFRCHAPRGVSGRRRRPHKRPRRAHFPYFADPRPYRR